MLYYPYWSKHNMSGYTGQQVTAVITDLYSVDNLEFNGNTISTTNSNGNLNLTPNGTGSVVISKADINGGTIDGTAVNATTLSASGVTNLDAGTVASPGVILEGETGTGLYRIGANNHGYAVSGAKVLDISSTGMGVTGAVTTSGKISATVAGAAGDYAARFGETVGANRGVWLGTAATGQALIQAYRPSDGDTAGAYLLKLGAGNAEVCEISSTGLAVTGGVTATRNFGGNQNITSSNNSTDGSAQARVQATNGTNTATFGSLGTNYTTTGIFQASRGFIFSDTTFLYVTSADSQIWSNDSGANAQMTLDALGNLHVPGGGGIATNEAFGTGALVSNTTGYYNTASGRNALYSNTTGISNTAHGLGALYSNTTGNGNTASGEGALYSNTTGGSNTANGFNALYSNTTGNYNTASGRNALYFSTGSSNTALGSQYTTAGTYAPAFNCTTEDNRVSIAHTGVTNAYINVAWTVVSDERDKTDFAPVPIGLEFINKLKPTSYRRKVSRDDPTPDGPVRYGFKAQDILLEEGATPVIVDNEDPDRLRLVDSNLLAVLVKAVQELSTKNDALEARLTAAGL
jgi:hypothetical protein